MYVSKPPVIERRVSRNGSGSTSYGSCFGFTQFSNTTIFPSVEIDTVPEAMGTIIGFEDLSKLTEAKKNYLGLLSDFLKILSATGLPKPEVSGDLTEDVSFEWRSESNNEFIVTIKPDNNLIYSGVFKSGNVFGAESFNGKDVSAIIKNNILKSV